MNKDCIIFKTVDEQVKEFHIAFDQPVLDYPQIPPIPRIQLRARLETEEHFELLDALGFEIPDDILHSIKMIIDEGPTKETDLVAAADAWADKDYVAAGSRHEFGVKGAPIAAEVHRSNMSKLVDGKPLKRSDGKVIKPATWTPPDIRGELIKQGWNP